MIESELRAVLTIPPAIDIESERGAAPRRGALPTCAAPRVVAVLDRIDRASLAALAYARSIAAVIVAVHVSRDRAESEQIRRYWGALGLDGGAELVTLESRGRSSIGAVVGFVDAVQAEDPDRPIAVVLSEFVPRHWWQYVLHNHTALQLKLRLFLRPRTVVVDVPYHL